MNKINIVLLCLGTGIFMQNNNITAEISSAPENIEQFKEIAVRAQTDLPVYFNQLTPQERIFIYYIFRASLPGNRIATDQIHRTGITVLTLCENMLKAEDTLRNVLAQHKTSISINLDQFFSELKIFLAYLWANHGQYFEKEHDHEKRTPHRLGMTQLTHENFTTLLTTLDKKEDLALFNIVSELMFDESREHTATVQNSIDESAVNIYARDFTDQDFLALPAHERTRLNAHFAIQEERGMRTPCMVPYKIGGKYDQELRVAHFWLAQALAHAKKYPAQFDQYLVASLKHLLDFIATGDEEYFKEHSKAWLKSNSRVDYTWGFIETYKDPKSYRGMFEAEATIKTIDINALNVILPAIEDALPFLQAYKRDTTGAGGLPNASINIQVFGAGEFGPLNVVAAYCLPNYAEIRSSDGSKQIIYHPTKSTGQLLNASLYRTLFSLKNEAAFLATHDPEAKLLRDIWTLQCILHETLGHGSGKLGMHTFKEGDILTIGDTTYSIGDTIAVTSDNGPELLQGYEQTLEELRAEIIALHASVAHYDAIAASGLLGDWPTKLGKDTMIQYLIKGMASTGLSRLLVQQDNATTMSGDHARANYTILNYLIEHGGIAVHEERITVDDTEYTVIGIVIRDTAQALKSITDLVTLVQTIKSTGDGVGAKELIETYGVKIRNLEHVRALKENIRAVMGDIKATATLYPIMTPVYDLTTGSIQDVATRWPSGLVEQELLFSELALSKE